MARIFRFFITTGLTWAALGLHLGICACYLRRWDKVAALTIFPFWAWGLLGLGMAGTAWIAGRRRLAAAVSLVWLMTIIIGADETRPLMRSWAEKPQAGEPAPAPDGRRPLRIVSLNCRAGIWHPEALQEVEAWQPDIVLLQEAPVPRELEKLTARLYGAGRGSWAGGWHCGIVARGRISDTITGYQPASILSTVEAAPGKMIEVACVHLAGAETNLRLWTRSAFRDHYFNRQSRRSELIRLLNIQQIVSRRHPAIVGGDFNAPAGDAVFDLLARRGFMDMFAAAGSGWPNTYPNTSPMLRIDHLWANGSITPVRATVVGTKHSDHRMVVCDFQIP